MSAFGITAPPASSSVPNSPSITCGPRIPLSRRRCSKNSTNGSARPLPTTSAAARTTPGSTPTTPARSAPNCLPRDWGRGTSAKPPRPTTRRSAARSGCQLTPPTGYAPSRVKRSPATTPKTTAGSSSREKFTTSPSGRPITRVALESPACTPARKPLPNSVTSTALRLSRTWCISASAILSRRQLPRCDWWRDVTLAAGISSTPHRGRGNAASAQRNYCFLLLRRFGGGGGRVFRVEFSNPIAPHSDECCRCQLIHRLPRVFDRRQRIQPDRALAPSFAFLHAFAGGAHGFPGDAVRLADVFGGAFPALLMDQVKIAQGRLLVRHPLEQNAFGNELVGRRNRIVAGIKNLAGAELAELVVAQLEQADIRPGPLVGVETGFDLGNRFHESEIQTKRVGSALDLVDRRSDRDVLE